MKLHPDGSSSIITLREICPDAVACRSQGINPWISAHDNPVCTITKTPYKGLIKTRLGVRCPTLAELKHFGSFPEQYQFISPFEKSWMRIGNSVPPLLIRAVAEYLAVNVLKRRSIRHAPVPATRKKKPYTEVLEEAWAASQAPRETDAPTVISTFAGGGGSSLGYHMAGFRELLAVEWDDNAVQTLRLNFPHLDVYHGDIAKLSVEEVLRRTGLEPGQLDVLDGSPPCQGFSTASKRDMNDDRNQLFREYVRLLRGLKPKCFVMENVSGMVKGKMKLIFAEILRELKASGYVVSARLLNAKHYGVPQSRERMIFVGVREDLWIEPSHPGGCSGVRLDLRTLLLSSSGSRSRARSAALAAPH